MDHLAWVVITHKGVEEVVYRANSVCRSEDRCPLSRSLNVYVLQKQR